MGKSRVYPKVTPPLKPLSMNTNKMLLLTEGWHNCKKIRPASVESLMGVRFMANQTIQVHTQ